jgi:hypothetical protein
MKPLDHLRQFICWKNTNDERHEIREYLVSAAADLAPEFGVSEDKFLGAIAAIGDDEQLAKRVTAHVKKLQGEHREQKKVARTCSAQNSADAFGQTIRWEYGAAQLDMNALLDLLSVGSDLLVFRSQLFPDVVIRQKLLIALRKLRKPDLRGWVDEKGLHIRWGSVGGGGFNFITSIEHMNMREREEGDRVQIVVNIPALAAVLPVVAASNDTVAA